MKDGSKLKVDGFYISMAVGFTISFWAFAGVLIFNGRLMYNYFAFLDNMGDRIYLIMRKLWYKFAMTQFENCFCLMVNPLAISLN